MKQHRLARRFEDQLATDLGGRRTFLSGAGAFDKADVKVSRHYTRTKGGVRPVEDETPLRIEAKTTQSPTYTFKLQDWVDLTRMALRSGEEPIFAISFEDRRHAYVLLRAEFARSLGFSADMPQDMKKSWTLDAHRLFLNQQRRQVRLVLLEDAPVLVLVPYTQFLLALRRS